MKEIKNMSLQLTMENKDQYSTLEAVLLALTRDITKTNDHHRKVASNLDHAKQVQKDVLKRRCLRKEAVVKVEYPTNHERRRDGRLRKPEGDNEVLEWEEEVREWVEAERGTREGRERERDERQGRERGARGETCERRVHAPCEP